MMPTIMTNDVRRDQLFGSGLVFSTGLVWFFVQAWIFAIQARTVWLIVLLTITTTVAILSQGYLCAIFVSIPPVSEHKSLSPSTTLFIERRATLFHTHGCATDRFYLCFETPRGRRVENHGDKCFALRGVDLWAGEAVGSFCVDAAAPYKTKYILADLTSGLRPPVDRP